MGTILYGALHYEVQNFAVGLIHNGTQGYSQHYHLQVYNYH